MLGFISCLEYYYEVEQGFNNNKMAGQGFFHSKNPDYWLD